MNIKDKIGAWLPRDGKVLREVAKFIATGAYSGYAPFASGTVGSFVCLILWYLLATTGILESTTYYLLITCGCIVIGTLATRVMLHIEEANKNVQLIKDEKKSTWAFLLGAPVSESKEPPHRHPAAKTKISGTVNGSEEVLPIKDSERIHSDPSCIVIDEWAGMLVSLYGVPSSNWVSIAAAFFLFRFFDVAKFGPMAWAETLPGEWGIMLDDIFAGILTALCIAIIF